MNLCKDDYPLIHNPKCLYDNYKLKNGSDFQIVEEPLDVSKCFGIYALSNVLPYVDKMDNLQNWVL